jgi:Glycosyl transferase family 2
MIKWGLVATIRAPAKDILNFAAYHLDLGAHRLYLYLDAANPEAFGPLKAHPKIRVITCDDTYWRKSGQPRPAKHQLRQTANATRAYARRAEVDWLIHIDVDEFLWPETTMAQHLEDLGPDIQCARIRPVESLAGDGTVFKGFIPAGRDRAATVERLYPNYGRFMKGGFLSHVAGKLFLRTGLGPLTVRIHNVFNGSEMNPGQTELRQVALCHCHAKNWEDWIAAYRYRLTKGAYREELPPAQPREKGGMRVHDLLNHIESTGGEAGLRGFYNEFCADTPESRAALKAENLLRICDLRLAARRRKHFPETVWIVSD